jgi:hypothetical protein
MQRTAREQACLRFHQREKASSHKRHQRDRPHKLRAVHTNKPDKSSKTKNIKRKITRHSNWFAQAPRVCADKRGSMSDQRHRREKTNPASRARPRSKTITFAHQDNHTYTCNCAQTSVLCAPIDTTARAQANEHGEDTATTPTRNLLFSNTVTIRCNQVAPLIAPTTFST